MANATLRFESDRYNKNGPGDRGRRVLALGLILVAAAAAYVVFSRDIYWQERNASAREQGVAAQHNGDFNKAREYYQAALANDPYDWRTHFDLANILNHRMGDVDNAFRHYLYCLAYSSDAEVNAKAEVEVAILRLIRAGELENPLEALDDMFVSAEAEAKEIFVRRLAPALKPPAQSYWQGWRSRGRAQVRRVRIHDRDDGYYDARVELLFPDDTLMSMHLISRMRGIWRLNLSFP